MKKIRKFLRALGPGFITGAADDDPSGIATYAQTGARFGTGLLWTPFFTFIFMAIIQEMCGRIGLVTGKGLSGVIRQYYGAKLLYFCVFLLLVANTVNIGANLGAMASSVRLLWDIPFTVILISLTVLTLILEVFVSYKLYARYLKYLAFSLLAYVVTAFLVDINWSEVVIHTFVPNIEFRKESVFVVLAILGATMSPYLFFWQANEEVDELRVHNKLSFKGREAPKPTRSDISKLRVDTIIGMLFSNAIMFFIILTTASTLGVNGILQIETATQAAQALRPLAGDYAYILFSAGIIGTGLLSVPVLAGSAAYALSEAFSWKAGLYWKFRQAHGFYGIITVATLIGLLVNFTPIEPFRMLFYTAILNGIVAPPLLIMILIITNNNKIMQGFTNSIYSNILGIIITALTITASLLMVFLLATGQGI